MYTHTHTHTQYNSPHVTVGVGNYLLKLSNMSKFAGTAISRNRVLNFLIRIFSFFMMYVRIKP